MILAIVLLVLSTLLAGVLALLEWMEFDAVRRGSHDAGSDAAGFVMGQGYILILAIAGAFLAAIALFVYGALWAWSAIVLAVHFLVIAGVQVTTHRNESLGQEILRNDSRLERCPQCGASVRADRLEKHIKRVHAGFLRNEPHTK